jgi:hypothetical protein
MDDVQELSNPEDYVGCLLNCTSVCRVTLVVQCCGWDQGTGYSSWALLAMEGDVPQNTLGLTHVSLHIWNGYSLSLLVRVVISF